MYKNSNEQSEMIEAIKAKRERMIICANTLGYTSEETIQYSQELDESINEYHKLMGQTARPAEEVKFAFNQMIMVWPRVLV